MRRKIDWITFFILFASMSPSCAQVTSLRQGADAEPDTRSDATSDSTPDSNLDSTPEQSPGTVVFGVITSSEAENAITEVSVTISEPSEASNINLSLEGDGLHWRGSLPDTPARSDWTLKAEALDASGTVIFEKEIENVTVEPDQATFFVIVLQYEFRNEETKNYIPLIDWIQLEQAGVVPGQTIEILAHAHDHDPRDTFEYFWTATGGELGSSESEATLWQAPAEIGTHTITLSVNDSSGDTESLSVNIDVHQRYGREDLQEIGTFNSWPRIAGLSTSSERLRTDGMTTLSVSATDIDARDLTYLWTDDGGECAGLFSDTASVNPTWTAPASYPTDPTCALTVTVSDEKDGRRTETINVFVTEALPPVIDSAIQSTEAIASVENVTFNIVASDPDSDEDLVFNWTSSTGSFDTRTDTGTTSEITWTPPEIVDELPIEISIVVTDSDGLTASHLFEVAIADLLLWNRLGSEDEVTNSEAGPDLMIEGTVGYIDAVFDQGMYSTGHWYIGNRVLIPTGGVELDPEHGTVEAWVSYPLDPIVRAYTYSMFSFLDGAYQSGPGRDETLGQQINFAVGDGVTGDLYTMWATIDFGSYLQIHVPDIDLIFLPETFHHVAIVWDRDGIDGDEETFQLWIDNKVVGSRTESDWGDEPDIDNRHTIGKGEGFNDGTPAFIVDNIRIWGRAISDFSGMDEEGITL